MAKNSTKYSLITSKIFIEGQGEITTYGLKTTNLEDNIVIKDISTVIEKVQDFIKLCNANDVSPIILEDILDDYIS